MHIEHEVKLNYDDVLIRPKRSTLGSRKEVGLERGFSFPNYEPYVAKDVLPDGYPVVQEQEKHFRGVPIIASNMDGVGTFEMADALSEQHIMTCLVKTYSVKELVDFYDPIVHLRTEFVAMSIGITQGLYN